VAEALTQTGTSAIIAAIRDAAAKRRCLRSKRVCRNVWERMCFKGVALLNQNTYKRVKRFLFLTV
jgi:hypothetical protein